jgi:adenine-specific DNA-methyltransferase
MDRIDGLSLNLEKNNIDKIKELFPEAVEEGKINFDMLRAMLGDEIDDSREKYQFTWNGKAKSIKLAQTPSSATLRPCKDKSEYWDTTENLYIEGDNLEVLKQLQKTYYGKIKMIYIDPPYNTGNDFVYNDSYSNTLENYKEQTNQISSSNPESNGRFHTDWLNMMYPRLLLAKNLLSDDGVIFISIDDNELENLKKICSEIFGESNFVGCLSVENNPKGRKNSAFISVSSEYCLIYAKSISNAYFIENVPKKASDMCLDENGRYVHNSGKRVLVGENGFNDFVQDTLSSKNYVVYYRKSDNDFVIENIENDDYLKNGYVCYSSYRNGKKIYNTYTDKKLMELFNSGSLSITDNKIFEKNYSDTVRIKSQLTNKKYDAIVHGVRKEYSMGLTTTGAGTYLKQLFNTEKVLFNAPKNIGYLQLLLSLLDGEDFTILDFFSGSASSADAIMHLNRVDGGNRKFIMVQLPELCDEKSEAYKAGYKNICEIGEERIHLAGEQIKSEWEKEHPSDGLFGSDEQFTTDIGFKVFKLDSTNVNEWDPNMKLDEKELAMRLGEVFKEDRNKEDILYEIMLKYGVFDKQVEEINVNGKTMYRVGKRYMIVCLDNQITSEDVKAIGELSPKTVIFNEAGFRDDNEKINATYNLKQCGVEDIKCI